ncbi:uncharacterized protein LOC131155842 [Malania oleifera]|uniref:uncharacterized protein LOC131155842 n=1 Tax=Malania oleifera TaxID=397392 RepID=UPI0025ADC3FB|nr:uncharacterized protein LOC131155842 [Malania oleifera]
MEFVVEDGKRLHDECSTLILPALSIGNVGQLALDLLIASTRAERIGYLDDPNVLPCVGNDAYGPIPQGELALPLEAYDSFSNALSLVQQRSPIVKGMMVEFAKNMADFAAATGKKHVLILSSLDFGRWQKIDLSSVSYAGGWESSQTERGEGFEGTRRSLEGAKAAKHKAAMTPSSEAEIERLAGGNCDDWRRKAPTGNRRLAGAAELLQTCRR